MTIRGQSLHHSNTENIIKKLSICCNRWKFVFKRVLFLAECNSVCRPWAKLVTEPSSEEVGTANFLKSFAVGFHLLTTLFSIVPSAQDKVVQQISQKRHKKLVNSGK